MAKRQIFLSGKWLEILLLYNNLFFNIGKYVFLNLVLKVIILTIHFVIFEKNVQLMFCLWKDCCFFHYRNIERSENFKLTSVLSVPVLSSDSLSSNSFHVNIKLSVTTPNGLKSISSNLPYKHKWKRLKSINSNLPYKHRG